MGISFSCPFDSKNDLENRLESIAVKSISFGDDEVKTTQRSICSEGEDSEPMIMKPLDSGKMIVEGSISFKLREEEAIVAVNLSSVDKEDISVICKSRVKETPISDGVSWIVTQSSMADVGNSKHEAALKLQKVYKSFRTRRKLADCAVLVEQSWWKLLDFAELKHSSISFFDIEHHETAISRWFRAKTRAAKVGKGLLKNDKAQKLALQHWLEAIDPRHRYGHNLHFYYKKWLQSQSREPFFYWIDIGEGREVNLVEKCPRSKLQRQCIKYLGPVERKAYEVGIEDGKLFYEQSGELLDTSTEIDAKWIFVLSTSKTLYIGKKQKGTFQHSSFLAGGATSAAGRLVVENGSPKAIWPHSGHYKPTPENFQDFIAYLKENNVDLTDVKMNAVDEDDQSLDKQRSSSNHSRSNSTEDDLIQDCCLEADETNDEDLVDYNIEAAEQESAAAREKSYSGSRKLSNLEIPKRDDVLRRMQREIPSSRPRLCDLQVEPPQNDGDGAAARTVLESKRGEKALERDLSDEEEDDSLSNEEIIPKEAILRRINSHKETESYQLGKQLSCKWTTGAGPRIGCVRDYPSDLQFGALEKVNLSPRSTGSFHFKLVFSPCRLMGLSPSQSSIQR
ncbi:hypothetical protein Nepgr_014652 [Nepenthes gracilis]|uniref:IQ domain-containing protein IQM2-like n=1 Tax=Nepenthes gracilis TaxID=150966 RepID=A0AAD3XQI8_NEPGR|nr:hypothetical protein Nepgr_014652 [Nepenthes gracilis]